MCPRYEKAVNSIDNLTKHVNVCKISIILLTCQSSNLALIWEYNTTNHLNFPLNNNKKDISQGVSNNGKERIRLTDIKNNKKDIKLVDIEKQRPVTPN